jgi:hypothetical protein
LPPRVGQRRRISVEHRCLAQRGDGAGALVVAAVGDPRRRDEPGIGCDRRVHDERRSGAGRADWRGREREQIAGGGSRLIEAGGMKRVHLVGHFEGEVVEPRLVVGNVDVAHLQQAAKLTARDLRSDRAAVDGERRVPGRRRVGELEVVLRFTDDERAAVADGDVHAAFGPIEDVDVHQLRELAHEARLIVTQVQR